MLHMMKDCAQQEIEKNYQAFREKLSALLEDEDNVDKFSLWHDGDMVGIFDTESDAIQVGKEKYKEFGKFSVQQIKRDAFDLGYISLCQ